MSGAGAWTCRRRGGFEKQSHQNMGRRATPPSIEAALKSRTRLEARLVKNAAMKIELAGASTFIPILCAALLAGRGHEFVLVLLGGGYK